MNSRLPNACSLMRLEERHGDKISARQRWRLLTLKANVVLGQGKLEDAGRFLLQAKQCQPQEEKAQVNEALGYELTGEIDQRHGWPSHCDKPFRILRLPLPFGCGQHQ